MPGKDRKDFRRHKHGLLPKGLEKPAREKGASPWPDGHDEPPPGMQLPPASEPDYYVPNMPHDKDQGEFKAWKERCYFSCIPFGWIPVDVYDNETISGVPV